MNLYQSDSLVNVFTGASGIASTTLLTQPTGDSTVQIVGIVCSCIIAVAHIGFGYLIWKNSKAIKP